MPAAEEEFYDAQEEEEDQRRAETVARLSSAVQNRLQVQMSEDQLHLPAEVAGGEALDLRIAIADFFQYREPYEDQDICEMVLFAQDQGSRGLTFKDLDYPVLLQNIEAPLFVHRYKDGDGRQMLAFAPLRFKTGGSRVQLLESVQ